MKKEKTERLVETIVKKLGKKGYDHLLKFGEMPAVKLTDEEMKYIKGGIDIVKILKESGKTVYDPNSK